MEEVVEKLIEEEVVNKEEATTQESTAEKTAAENEELAKIKAENERLRKANKTLNEKVKKAPKEEEEVQADPTDELNTREGWMKLIEETAEKKASEKFAKVRESALKRAKDRFVSSHPEYSASEKLRPLLERASALGLASKDDEAEMVECLMDAWAIENRKDLESVAIEKSKSRERAQRAAASATAGSSSEKVEEEYTEDERAEAAKHGMTPDRFKRAAALLEESTTTL